MQRLEYGYEYPGYDVGKSLLGRKTSMTARTPAPANIELKGLLVPV